MKGEPNREKSFFLNFRERNGRRDGFEFVGRLKLLNFSYQHHWMCSLIAALRDCFANFFRLGVNT
uniref:Uncharacterized protein n=1 Tax=Utricularia reniformis TaxID=192314 RepID=A0A1Y0B2T2_9LAMI|nr:hypothetical protein AEK19_MT1507 [Utricularia reniformis]ART31698.1 hypothetical protein AEK19_MT1507 [Utricularia reniformis]